MQICTHAIGFELFGAFNCGRMLQKAEQGTGPSVELSWQSAPSVHATTFGLRIPWNQRSEQGLNQNSDAEKLSWKRNRVHSLFSVELSWQSAPPVHATTFGLRSFIPCNRRSQAGLRKWVEIDGKNYFSWSALLVSQGLTHKNTLNFTFCGKLCVGKTKTLDFLRPQWESCNGEAGGYDNFPLLTGNMAIWKETVTFTF